MKKLEIGYSFKNPELLDRALTHSSYANENRARRLGSNERLEFLGDAVLGFAAAQYLYRKYEGRDEGNLTRTRAKLVCEQSLAQVASSLCLAEHMNLGKGEIGEVRQSLLADALEAVIGAVYLDGGIGQALEFIDRFILSRESEVETDVSVVDYKSALQELVQQDRTAGALSYRLVSESGPDHDKVFDCEALVGGERAGLGKGKSKKEAEQAAARDAFERRIR